MDFSGVHNQYDIYLTTQSYETITVANVWRLPQTGTTCTIIDDRLYTHSVTLFEFCDTSSDLLDNAAELMPKSQRHRLFRDRVWRRWAEVRSSKILVQI